MAMSTQKVPNIEMNDFKMPQLGFGCMLFDQLPIYAHDPKHIRKALDISLKDLGVDYIDLYLIHCPFAYLPRFELDGPYTLEQVQESFKSGVVFYNDSDLLRTWKHLEACVDEGLVKAIGVSNFNSKQVQLILENSRIKPVNNQIESHPYFNNSRLVEFCQSRGITVTSYSTFGFPPPLRGHKDAGYTTPLKSEKIEAIAKKHSKTPAQILLRFQIQRNLSVIPRTSNTDRLKENINVFDFSLDEGDMKAIFDLDKQKRLYTFEWAKEHKDFPLHEDF